jgi:CheY-like chemotaxis protein
MSSDDKAIAQRTAHRLQELHDEEARRTKLHGSILVVNDSKEGRAVISSVLRCIGLAVETSGDGQVACQRALTASHEGRPFDLILLDIHMPGMDSHTATAHLRAHGYSGRIAALTANSDEGAREAGPITDYDDFATKPVTFEMLFDLAQRNLRATSRPMRSATPRPETSALRSQPDSTPTLLCA